MNEPVDPKSVRKDEIAHIGEALTQGMTLYLEAGFTPGEITAGLTAAVFAVMKSFGMSELAIANALHKLADEVREKAFVENSRLN